MNYKAMWCFRCRKIKHKSVKIWLGEHRGDIMEPNGHFPFVSLTGQACPLISQVPHTSAQCLGACPWGGGLHEHKGQRLGREQSRAAADLSCLIKGPQERIHLSGWRHVLNDNTTRLPTEVPRRAAGPLTMEDDLAVQLSGPACCLLLVL